ncbi:RHS repeat-associated core domain-containing protein [Filimonas lacunae]|uniref:RHS repeat-associated core domain-containing protein n=1 Tax=Filimonas lacunae TaxID=477680 RepID=A0A173MN81_9BACT|nr:DUF6443 domain-containing protein [Filimonas lacunae]BAV09094.1 cell well associated RhsD protein [Filimonas lacunae]SIS67213.1 RHS repeat-associated core domain-containing protein [Filimonas lacunae]
MKTKYYYLLLLMVLGVLPVSYAIAQDATVPATTAYVTNLNNYICSWQVVKPETNTANITLTNTLHQAQLTFQYVDGLGRPLQTVARKGSMITGSAAVDLVTPVVYDVYGRVLRQYLPYAANEVTGAFKLNALAGQQSFYAGASSPINGQGETFYYSKTEYEASPLNRVARTYAAGNSWVKDTGNGIIQKFLCNTTVDEVRLWRVQSTGGSWPSYITDSSYRAGDLLKTVTRDEQGKQVIEFTDKAGKIVLKKVQLTAAVDTGIGSAHSGWLCTYYVYDLLGQLRAVIQPEGVKLLEAGSWMFTATLYNEQCFRYEYDGKRRMIVKKVPGAFETEIVYDARDRVVLTRDGNMRAAGKWVVSRYDAIDRPIQTWLWNNVTTRSAHQAAASSSIDYPGVSGLTELLIETYYDNYTWSGNPFGTTRSTTESNGVAASNSVFPYPQDNISQSSKLKGLVTGMKVKVLDTAQYLYSINFYDNRGRVIQTQSNNYSGGIDLVNTQYTFSGQPYIVINRQTKSGTNAQTTVTASYYTYDSLLRLAYISKGVRNTNVNSGTWLPNVTISELVYDALGQVQQKKLGRKKNGSGGYLTTPVETLTYSYNIRGWLLGINKSYITNSSSTANYFGMELGYDKNAVYSSSAKYYNGNIGVQVWRTQGDGEKRRYEYAYDAASRILKADFGQYTGSVWSNTTVNFNMKMGDGADPNTAYDANGNIKRMQHWGLKGTGILQLDNLSYNYYFGSNKLMNVVDSSNDVNTGLGDFRSSSIYLSALGGTKTNAAVDYTYDSSGNLLKDLNKDIGTATIKGISYNFLNLPQLITVANKGTIRYVYDATGKKWAKVVNEIGKPANYTVYLNANTFINNELQTISHEEGRVTYTAAAGSIAAKLSYDYFVKDHLGNVRMVLTEGERSDAYPPASMETAPAATEETFYSNVNTTRVNKPSGYPTDTYTNPNDKVSMVNGSGNKIGPGILLKVMAGDAFTYRANSWWSDSQIDVPVNLLSDLVTALSAGIGGVSNKASVAELAASSSFSTQIGTFLNSRGNNPIVPKAYVQWVLFDEQFNYVAACSGSSQVGAGNSFTTHMPSSAINLTKNGYLYVFVSNETQNQNVYFDNLQVTHIHGAILEETHYYPFGLTMAGISTGALNFSKVNRLKFNAGSELNGDVGLNWYETKIRGYDQQLGRFHQQDPLCDEFNNWSSYSFAYNDPNYWIDPMGAENISWEELKKRIENGTIQPGRYQHTSDGNTFEGSPASFFFDKSAQTLHVWTDPTYNSSTSTDANGVTSKEGFYTTGIHYKMPISDEYMPYEENGWDYVPFVGESKKAADEFYKGRWMSGAIHSALAASDLFLIKAAFTGLGKVAIKASVSGFVSLANRETKIYRIIDNATGTVYKYGITSKSLSGSYTRLERQLAKLGGGYSGAYIATLPNRAIALDLERYLVTFYKYNGPTGFRPPKNFLPLLDHWLW